MCSTVQLSAFIILGVVKFHQMNSIRSKATRENWTYVTTVLFIDFPLLHRFCICRSSMTDIWCKTSAVKDNWLWSCTIVILRAIIIIDFCLKSKYRIKLILWRMNRLLVRWLSLSLSLSPACSLYVSKYSRLAQPANNECHPNGML